MDIVGFNVQSCTCNLELLTFIRSGLSITFSLVHLLKGNFEMSANCSNEFSSIGADNISDDTKLSKTKGGSLDTDAVVVNEEDVLCSKFNQLKITSHSPDASVRQIQDKSSEAQPEEQNCESGDSNTSALLQHGISEGEHGASCHGGIDRCANKDSTAGGAEASGNASELTQSEVEAKVQAIPVDDDDKTASTTRQESLPLATEPNASAVTSQTPQQGQVPHTPTSQEAPEEDNEHYDVFLMYSKRDKRVARQFFDIARKANWKVVTSDDFLPNQTKFKSFEDVHKNSSYTVLLLTSNFKDDIWSVYRYETALTQSIENPIKRETVVPVICQGKPYKMPIELSRLNGVNIKNPCIEKMLLRTIRVERRLKREKAEEKQT